MDNAIKAGLGLAFISLGFAGAATAAIGDVLNIRLSADDMFSVYISGNPNQMGQRIAVVAAAGTDTPVSGASLAPDGQEYQGKSWTAAFDGQLTLTPTQVLGAVDPFTNLPVTVSHSGTLYVNVVAQNHTNNDDPNPAGMIADLSLTGSSFAFGNATQDLTTAQTQYWSVGVPATGSTYNLANQYGWGGGLITNWQAPVVAGNAGNGDDHATATGYFGGGAWIWDSSVVPYSTADDQTPRFFQTTIAYMAVPEPTTMLLGGMALMPLLAYRRRSKAV